MISFSDTPELFVQLPKNRDTLDNSCIIFDCDGVLVDSEKLQNCVLVEEIKPYGVEMTVEEALRRFKGGKMANCIAEVQKLAPRPLPEDFVPYFREQVAKTFEKWLRPVKGIAESLEKIVGPKCVASSSPLEKIRHVLTITGTIHHFNENLFSAYTIESWKPDPDLFLHSAREMGFRPDQCIVIEDSILGVQASISAKMPVLCYCEDHDGEEMAAQGATVFHSMTELPELIDNARQRLHN
jgi:HAD superfamily hydrolase (TIGR01509 family)